MQQNQILLNTQIGNIEIPVSKYAFLLKRALGLSLSSSGDNRKVLAELFSNLSASADTKSVKQIKEDLSLVSDLLGLMNDSNNNQYAVTSNPNDLTTRLDANGVFTATWEGSTYVIKEDGRYLLNNLVVEYLPQIILHAYCESKNKL